MAKTKNKYGQYFTVDSIAEFMVTLITHDIHANVLEPSCGRGVFLGLLKKHLFNNLSAYEIDKSLSINYSFVKYESFVTSPISEKYDVVIGNPPYIRWKNLEDDLKKELETSELWNHYFNSLCDYLFIFILKSIIQLKENGELIFICPEYWMNTTHSKSLRDFMVKEGGISDIYHFKEAPLFEGVTSSFIIFRYVKNEYYDTIRLHRYNKRGKPVFEELQNNTCFNSILIPQFKIGERWILASSNVQKDITNFEGACVKQKNIFNQISELYRIGDFCDIGNGMVSGLDKAFQINNVQDLNSFEKSQLICVYKAKDLEQYYNASKNYYFFIKEPLDENDFKTKCPNLYLQIITYSEPLSKRYNYGKDLKIWEFAFPRNERLFDRKEKRIFIPCKERISSKQYFRFALADSGVYPLQDVTGILRKKNCREDIEYVLAYLNNKRVFEWLRFNGIVKGDIVEFSEAPVASIPYRPIDWTDEYEVDIHNNIVSATKQYIQTKDKSFLSQIESNFNLLFYENDRN